MDEHENTFMRLYLHIQERIQKVIHAQKCIINHDIYFEHLMKIQKQIRMVGILPQPSQVQKIQRISN